MAIFPGTAITPAGGAGYTIDQSLRFNDDDSARLSWTPSTNGNLKTWTFSCWVKRGNIGTNQFIFHSNDSDRTYMNFNSDDTIQFTFSGGGNGHGIITTAVFRDPSAWYHIVGVGDSTNATSSDRLRLYVNGSRITDFTNYGDGMPSLNLDSHIPKSGNTIDISGYDGSGGFFDGYLAEYHFIDGQALTPDSFGEVDATYGHWKPIRYSGSYGTNGFYLPFSGTFYNDASGNGNNWTANNLATTDVVLDSPTNNFATLNPLSSKYGSMKEGNLAITTASYFDAGRATMSTPLTGKWIVEMASSFSGGYPGGGIVPTDMGNISISAQHSTYGPAADGEAIYEGSENVSYGGRQEYGLGFKVDSEGDNFGFWSDGTGSSASSVTRIYKPNGNVIYNTSSILALALDLDNERAWIGVACPSDGDTDYTWYGSSSAGTDTPNTASTGLDISGWLNNFQGINGGGADQTKYGGFTFCTAQNGASEYRVNFGQDSSFAGWHTAGGNTDANGYGDFWGTVPSGFLSLCSQNLSEPAVVPGENFGVELYTGVSNSATFAVDFNPDLVWLKSRSLGDNHYLQDNVRGFGAYKSLSSNTTGYEGQNGGSPSTQDVTYSSGNLTIDGGDLASSSATYVTWLWKADNTSGSSNTDGSITSTVAANVDAGFSIVAWTANGNSSATVGHGLSQKPDIYIRKRRDSTSDWYVHTDLIDGTPDFLALNLTDAQQAGSALATSTTFPADTGSTATHISYCFHSVDGYSKFGSYTGNGSSDGPFVYTGFRPRFILIKGSDYTSNWNLFDTARDSYNNAGKYLRPNSSDQEFDESGGTGTYDINLDILSNGFKPTNGAAAHDINKTSASYIYMAFAEYPFSVGGGIAR